MKSSDNFNVTEFLPVKYTSQVAKKREALMKLFSMLSNYSNGPATRINPYTAKIFRVNPDDVTYGDELF